MTARDPITPIPNELLSQLRNYIAQSDLEPSNHGPSPTATYARRAAAVRASELIAHLDAGGRLPDAWTPFAAPRTGCDDYQERHAPTENPFRAELRETESNANQHIAAVEHERNQLRAALAESDAENERQHDRANNAEHEIEQLRAAIEQHKIDLRNAHEVRRCAEIDRDAGLVERDQLRADLADTARDAVNAREELRAAHRTNVALRDRNADYERQLAAAHRAPSIASDLVERAALAELAEQAAEIADDADTNGGTARDVRAAADWRVRNAIQRADSTGSSSRDTLAALLAVGASRYSSRRKDDDLAHRTATHLRTLADQLRTTQAP